jgi:hypothetical protein
VIGYYVHHHGRGHLHRAVAVAGAAAEPVTVLSSLPPPDGFAGEWVQLPRDDEGPTVPDPTARGRLHWVPAGDAGLRTRMHRLSRWLDTARPRLLVVDVSVEVTLLARLHGVPVVSVVLPGRRDDAAHLLGLDVADALVAVWPPSATPAMLPGLPGQVRDRVAAVGGLARFPVVEPAPAGRTRRAGSRRVVVLGGAGGSGLTESALAEAGRSAPVWEWTLCGPPGPWVDDVAGAIRDADVVVTHAGQNAIAEVAASRRPAVVVPQARPYDEQAVTAAALRSGGWPALVLDDFPRDGWAARLDHAADLDGSRWSAWCDGGAAARFAGLLAETATGAQVA